MPQRQLVIVDPAVHTAEVDCFNRIALRSSIPATYHLPGLVGMDSLRGTGAPPAGIIVLGSSTSVHDDRPWQRPLETWLMTQMAAGTPTLGLCFGHQLIAHLFGGEVGFLFPDKKKLLGFRPVSLEADRLWGNSPKQGELFASHREAVVKCPKEMRVIARSNDVTIDGLAHQTLPVWAFQTHPEATPLFVASQGAPLPPSDSTYRFGHSLVDAFVDFAAKAARP